MKEQKTLWTIFRDFVNSKEIGSIITRQEIIKHVETLGIYFYNIHWVSQKDLYREDKQYVSTHTLDYMRNLAEKVGYLDKTRCAVVYVVNKHFPSGYTVSQLRKDYDKLW